MVDTSTTNELKVADEVWIAAALLHREHPERIDFSVSEIVERARREAAPAPLRRGVEQHAVQHCVAHLRANPGRYRMLVATPGHRRRLFRAGDAYDASREGAKYIPRETEIPQRYHDLLRWYASEYAPWSSDEAREDPLLALRGSGKRLWAGEHADAYVNRLRQGWGG